MERNEPKKGVVWGAVIAGLLLVGGLLVPSPYVIEQPGPVVNTLGSLLIDGVEEPVISVSGTETFETSEQLNLLTMTTVGTPDNPLSWLRLLPALLDETQRIVPAREVFPEDLTPEERREMGRLMMEQSQLTATAAALNAADIEFDEELIVLTIGDRSPADGHLKVGDRILTVNGVAVEGFADLRAQIARNGAGQAATFVLERGGEFVEVLLVPEEREASDYPVVGITVETRYTFPFQVDISLDRIGGPSAGMMFALAIYDELTPKAVAGTLNVSGTGTIDEHGNVGAIGGLPQKVWAASSVNSDVLLFPASNCEDLPATLPHNLTLVPVTTLDEAIRTLEVLRDAPDESAGKQFEEAPCSSHYVQGPPVG